MDNATPPEQLWTCRTTVVVAMGDAAAAPPLLEGVVRSREEWAGGLPVPGPLDQEAAGDVRFLIVHHTASTNRYAAGDVPAQIRGFDSFNTEPEKGSPDVAYSFFVDRYGGVWEGRAGCLAGPVKPDATGGARGPRRSAALSGPTRRRRRRRRRNAP